MKQLGYYAVHTSEIKNAEPTLHKFEWIGDKLHLIQPNGESKEVNKDDYEILEIGYFMDEDENTSLTPYPKRNLSVIEMRKHLDNLEIVEYDGKLSNEFRKIYATEFSLIKTLIANNLCKKKTLKLLEELANKKRGAE